MYTKFHGAAESIQPDKVLRERYFPDYGYIGLFLDVGAGDPILISNSYHFRQNGWKILSVEPNSRFVEKYRQDGFTIAECVVGSKNGEILFEELNLAHVGGNVHDLHPHVFNPQNGVISLKPLRTLDSLLSEEFSPLIAGEKIDIISLDVELYETEVLKGLTDVRYFPSVFLIEAHEIIRDDIREWMTAHEYTLDFQVAHNQYYVRQGFFRAS